MIKYTLDKEKSKEVYKHSKNQIKIKECYNNVFKVVTANQERVRSGKWKVAYGYITVIQNLLCRHCFIIDENNMVIDPTFYAFSQKREDVQYFTMKVFDDIDAYFKAIEQERYYPALLNCLKKYDDKAQKWADKTGYILM